MWKLGLLAAAAGAVIALILRRAVQVCLQWLSLHAVPGRKLKPCGVRRTRPAQLAERDSDVR